MTSRAAHIAIAGATGAVGVEFLRLFEQRGFPVASLRLLASARSAGSIMEFRGSELMVEELGEGSFEGIDVALFSAGGSVSRAFAPRAVDAGAVVVDNSSAFRMTEGVPLVIPEVNAREIDALVAPDGSLAPGIIANPNCSTIIMLLPLHPLREAFGLRRVVVSTYQAVSGAGAAAMDELAAHTRAALDGREEGPKIFREPCAFNVFSHDSAVDPETGRNVEEQKMIDETRKIWNDPRVAVAPTCLRVPVMRAHTESMNITLERPATEAEVRDALAGAPGVALLDDRVANAFPTPARASGIDDVLVGRVRPDPTQPREGDRHAGWELLVSGDQLRKGAALNAVQIAERLLGR